MLDFIPQILILVGLGGGVAVLVRKAKYIPDEGLKLSLPTAEKLRAFWQTKIVERFPGKELENWLLTMEEKFLRRGRILAMKADYLFLRGLEKVRETKSGRLESNGNYWGEFAKPEMRFSFADLLEAELRLEANPLFARHEEYRRLAEVYLVKGQVGEARRLLIEAWRRDGKDPEINRLLEAAVEKA